MTTLLFYCIILFIITYFFIRKFITMAPKIGFVDIPNERSSHKKVTPRGAGIVFGFIFLFGIVFFDLGTFSENKYTFLAILSIKSLTYINPAAVLFLAAVPILDTLVVFRRRIQRGQSPFEADKNHLHHILNNIKQDKAFTVKMLIYIQLVFSCMFFQLHKESDFLNLVVFLLLFLIFFNLFDPRAKRRPKTARLRKKYQKMKEEMKLLKEKE